MFWTFVATIFAGLGAAGLAYGLRTITRQKAPKWIIPAFAGIGMLTFLAYGEYNWFDHKQSQLPDGAVVISKERQSVIWRPWSLVVPQIFRFTVLDTGSVVRDTRNPDLVTFYLYRFEKSYTDSVTKQVYLLNCGTRELVPINDKGKALPQALRKLSEEDRLLGSACS